MISFPPVAAEVKPVEISMVPVAVVMVEDDSWIWSDEFADAMAEAAADAEDLDRYCEGFLPF